MRNTAIFLFLAVLALSGWAMAQEEDFTVKGIIPFELKEHLIVIKVKINGSQKHYNFLLDTGGLTFIDKKVAEELALKTRGNSSRRKLHFVYLSGQVRRIRLRRPVHQYSPERWHLDKVKKFGKSLQHEWL